MVVDLIWVGSSTAPAFLLPYFARLGPEAAGSRGAVAAGGGDP